MNTPQSLAWIDPLEMASTITDPTWMLLYSGVRTSYSGRYSLLACNLAEQIQGDDFSAFEARLTHDLPAFANAWFGFLGYGLKNQLEALSHDAPSSITLPDLAMMRFETACVFDHEEKSLTVYGAIPNKGIATSGPLPSVAALTSNMSKAQYLEKAAYTIERIRAGDLYQANLTRKFTGEFAETPDAFALFTKLCQTSPAPYSAFIRMGEQFILSSSPEQFMNISPEGQITTRPIKGSAPRSGDAAQDEAARKRLRNSDKDRAENLMIADLMRNDLSRCCLPGSVKTEKLFEVTSHATIHHMSSTVLGQKNPGCTTLAAVKAAFPPGSMTGAPKIKAMQLCSALEPQARGLYSGAIGWFGGDGSCELAVVIRTLILQGKRFEFQVGGGIVSDSTPEREWIEHIDKSIGIISALGIPRQRIEAL